LAISPAACERYFIATKCRTQTKSNLLPGRESHRLDDRPYKSTTGPNLFFLFSRDASEKLFDVHLYQPYSLSMLAEFENLLDGPPKVETYETVLG
jgi:hypothetical protein